MPHDANGQELKVGDHVNVPMVVSEVWAAAENCNLMVKTPPDLKEGQVSNTLTLNTTQVVKQ